MERETKLTESDIPGICETLKPQVRAYLLAKANAQMWREQMDKWDREYLAEINCQIAEHWIGKGERRGRITDPDKTYLMSEQDAADYQAERQRYVDSLKIPGLQDGYCPALVAENLQRETEYLIIETAKQFFGEKVTVNNLLCTKGGLDNYHKYIDMLVGMTVKYFGDHGRTAELLTSSPSKTAERWQASILESFSQQKVG